MEDIDVIKKIVGNNIKKSILSEWKLFTIIVIGIIVFLLHSEIPGNSFERTIWSINREAYHYIQDIPYRILQDIPYSHDEGWRRVKVPDDSSKFFDYAFCFITLHPAHPAELQGVYGPEPYEDQAMILLSSEIYRIDYSRPSHYCKNFRFPQRLGIGLFEVILEVFGIFLLLQYIKTKLLGNKPILTLMIFNNFPWQKKQKLALATDDMKAAHRRNSPGDNTKKYDSARLVAFPTSPSTWKFMPVDLFFLSVK